MAHRPTYATVEDVKTALDIKYTARADGRIARALEAAADNVDSLCNRRFYHVKETRYKDWPPPQGSRSWVLWLDADELVSVTSLTAGGTTIASTDYLLRPDTGPPYNRIEIDLSSSAAFAAGDTHQRAIAITGVWGYDNHEHAAGALAEALDNSETGVDVTDSSLIGVGDIIRVDNEHMLVTGKSMLDTGVTASALTAAKNDVSITASTTTGIPQVGETILIGSERMLVVDAAGTTLTVERAYDGSVLAAHSAASAIWAPRTLIVERGEFGTNSATHTTSTTVYRHVVPGLVRQLALAEAIAILQQDGAGWARQAGSGDNARDVTPVGLPGLRAQVYAAHGRKARHRAV